MTPSIENPGQDAEKAGELRSQSSVSLQRTPRVRFGRRTPFGLAGRLFEHPATCTPVIQDMQTMEFLRTHRVCPLGRGDDCASSPAYGMVRMLTLPTYILVFTRGYDTQQEF